jgi:hypothetical protein
VFVSNYRVYFRAAPGRPFRGGVCWPDWAVPVHCVGALEATKSSDRLGPGGAGRVGRTLVVGCKDGQVKRFSAVRADAEAHVLRDEVHALQQALMRQAFKPEETFAKVSAVGPTALLGHQQ